MSELWIWLPLGAAVAYTAGAVCLKRHSEKGGATLTALLYVNVAAWVAFWPLGVVAWVGGDWPPASALRGVGWWGWGSAVLAGLGFMVGQVFTLLAVRFGDVSVQTPVMGAKVVGVAGLAVALGGSVGVELWWAAGLATAAVVMLGWPMKRRAEQSAGGPVASDRAKRVGSWGTAGLSLVACLGYAAADVLLARDAGAAGGLGQEAYLLVMMATVGLVSLATLPVRPGWWVVAKGARGWLAWGGVLFTVQCFLMGVALAFGGDATTTNVVYSTRGLLAVVLVWGLGRRLGLGEAGHGWGVMTRRLVGAGVLVLAVILAV
ncbi:MAG: hypothetical protein AAF750_02720 [Planctomycetota bacterium]